MKRKLNASQLAAAAAALPLGSASAAYDVQYHVLSQSSVALLCFLLLDGVYHFLLCRFLRLLCTMCFSWCSAALLCFLLLGAVYHFYVVTYILTLGQVREILKINIKKI